MDPDLLDALRKRIRERALERVTEDPSLLQRIEGLPVISQISGLARGVGDSVNRTGQGIRNLALGAARLVPGESFVERGLEDIAERGATHVQEQARKGPQGLSRTLGNVAGEVAQYAGVGAGSGALGLGKLAGFGANAALDAATVAVGPENSTAGALADLTGSETLERAAANPLTRFGSEVAVGALGEKAIRGGARALGFGDEGARAASRASDSRTPKPDGNVRVRDVDPSFGTADRANVINALPDPDGLEGAVDRVSRLKEAGDIPPSPTRGVDQLRAEAASPDFDEIVGQRRKATLTDVEVARVQGDLEASKARALEINRTLSEIDRASPEYDRLTAELGRVEEQIDQSFARYFEGGSQSGRNLAALRHLAHGADDPRDWIQIAKRFVGPETPMTAERIGQIRKLHGAGDKEGLVDLLRSWQQPINIWKDPRGLTLLRKAGLLSGAKSIGRAVFGNSVRGVTDAAGKPASVFADWASSLLVERLSKGAIKGSRTTTTRGLKGWQRTIEGAKKGLKEIPQVLKRGLDQRGLDRLDLARETRLESGIKIKGHDVADVWTNAWFRTQAALDKPFSRAAYDGALWEQAKLRAKEAGLTPEELFKSPTPDMQVVAGIAADYASFQQKTALGTLGENIREGARRIPGGAGKAAQAGVDLFIPFVKTPSAVVTSALEATPAGLVAGLVDLGDLVRLSRRVDPNNKDILEVQARFARRMGRVSVGMFGMLMGARWYREGKLTAEAPESTSERQTFYRSGKRPFHLNVNDRWWSMAQGAPLNSAIAVGAAMAQAEEESRDQFTSGATTVGRLAVETPFLRGTKDLIGLAEDTRNAPGIAGNIAGSFVPTVVADAARAIDPERKQPRRDTFANAASDAVRSRIPGLSQDVPARIDPLSGENELRETRGQPTTAAQAFGDIFGSSPDKRADDALIAELDRVGAATSTPQKQSGETPEDYRERQQIEGQIMGRVLNAVFLNPSGPEAEQLARQAKLNLDDLRLYLVAKGQPDDTPMQNRQGDQLTAIELQRQILEDAITRVRRTVRSEIKKSRTGAR